MYIFRCTGVQLYWITFSDTPQSVGIPWTSDRHVAEVSIWQHTSLRAHTHPCLRRDSNPQPQKASDRTLWFHTDRPLWSASIVIKKRKCAEAWVRCQASQCGICDGQSDTVTGFLRVLQFSPVSIIPLTLHTHLLFNTTLIRRTSGRSFGTFTQNIVLSDIGEC
jgi:hypothetical protein